MLPTGEGAAPPCYGDVSRGISPVCGFASRRSARWCDQLHGAAWPRGLSKTTVGRAERPSEGLGEGDIARLVGGDVRAKLEGSMHQPTCREPGKRDLREILDGLPESFVGEGAGQPASPEHSGGLDINKIRCREFSVHAEQVTSLPTDASSSPTALASTEASTTITRGNVHRSGLLPPERGRPGRHGECRHAGGHPPGWASRRAGSTRQQGTAATTARALLPGAEALGASPREGHGRAHWSCLHYTIGQRGPALRHARRGCSTGRREHRLLHRVAIRRGQGPVRGRPAHPE